MAEAIFGIDLGTTFSCIAGFDENGKEMVFLNEDNNTFTPSVVWFDGKSIVVGAEAKRMAAIRPEAVVSWVKRYMGTNKMFPIPGNLSLRSETVSSLVLRKLIKDVSSKYGIEVKKAVITCPAYFGNNEREATKKAGEMAGLDVVGIINEPTAAAFAYGMDKAEGERTVLVYDLGGGTFDVTIMRISKNEIRVVATGGDPRLGGVDWDRKLAELLAERVAEETREDYDDILEDAAFMAELQNEAEAAKIALTKMSSHRVSIRRKGVSMTTDVTRKDFEAVTESLIKRTIDYVNDTLSDAGKKTGKAIALDTVLLVGGSSYMPQVAAIVQSRFPDVEVKKFKPTEAVARGAAFYGRQMAIREIVKEDTGLDIFSEGCDSGLELSGDAEDEILSLGGQPFDPAKVIRPINVCSKSYGSICLSTADEEQREIIVNIIKRNSELPASASADFTTLADGQTGVKCGTYENDSNERVVELDQARELFVGTMTGLPPNRPKGRPLRDTYNLDEFGILKVTCTDLESGQVFDYVVETTNVITDKQLMEEKRKISGLTLV